MKVQACNAASVIDEAVSALAHCSSLTPEERLCEDLPGQGNTAGHLAVAAGPEGSIKDTSNVHLQPSAEAVQGYSSEPGKSRALEE
jgi:hypothetical protein